MPSKCWPGKARDSLCEIQEGRNTLKVAEEPRDATESVKKDVIRYIVVVHGIGEQRKNETILPVINRFAEVRRGSATADASDALTLGLVTSQTGKEKRADVCRYNPGKSRFTPWLEFAGIPQEMPTSKEMEILKATPFIGEEDDSGKNLRFVDCCWADVLQADIGDVGQPAEVWAGGLIARLKRKDAAAQAKNMDEERVPGWILHVLRIMKATIGVIRKAMAIRAAKMEEMIFTKFLGDVQLYGDYSHTRGQGVRRFHRLMAWVEKEHEKEEQNKEHAASDRGENYQRREARYTILAHSLGTVMSLDALLYACAKKEIRKCQKHEDLSDELKASLEDFNLPFEGFLTSDEGRLSIVDEGAETPASENLPETEVDEMRRLETRIEGGFDFHSQFLDTSWVDRVDSFVTLGSPIDKYLVLWWPNYKYLTNSDWMDPDRREARQREKIHHYNYCDEQDPVGHELNVVETAAAYKEVFEKTDEKVYNRYTVPGVAHVGYWADLPLFRWILRWAVDKPGVSVDNLKSGQERGSDPPIWFSKWTYFKILLISYFIIPLAVILADFFTFTWAWNSTSWQGTALATTIFIFVCWIGRHLIDLMIWWRQTLRRKRIIVQGGKTRSSLSLLFRYGMPILTVIHVVLAVLFASIYFHNNNGHLLRGNLDIALWSLVTVVVLIISSPFKGEDEKSGMLGSILGVALLGVVIVAAGKLFEPLPTLSEGLRVLRDELTRGEQLANLAFLFAAYFFIAAIVWMFVTLRFYLVRGVLKRENVQLADFASYIGGGEGGS